MLCHSPGGFRVWWRRWHADNEDELDNTHLLRLAGRFSRRVLAFGKAHIPVIDWTVASGNIRSPRNTWPPTRSAQECFSYSSPGRVATVWQVTRSKAVVIRNLEKKKSYVNHYSFHVMDPHWGHLTIKMSGRPSEPRSFSRPQLRCVALQPQAAGIGSHQGGQLLHQRTA